VTCHRNGKLLTSHIKYYFRTLRILCVQFNWIFKTLGNKSGKAGILIKLLSISHLWRNEDLVILTIKTLIPILKLIVRIFENGIVLNSKHLFALKDLFGSLNHSLNISHNLTLVELFCLIYLLCSLKHGLDVSYDLIVLFCGHGETLHIRPLIILLNVPFLRYRTGHW